MVEKRIITHDKVNLKKLNMTKNGIVMAKKALKTACNILNSN